MVSQGLGVLMLYQENENLEKQKWENKSDPRKDVK
jgi:hypothetical protein